MSATPRPNPVVRLGLWIKRAATFVYGPAEIRPQVDPVVDLDRQLGREPQEPVPPKLTERQQPYQDLPRGTAE
jgi:hypothetical protein